MDLIQPMEPLPQKEIPDSDRFTYQLKWDGVRMLAYIGLNRVELINKRLNNRTSQYPELQLLSALLKGQTAVLDGEVVAFREARPSFPMIMRRDNARTPASIDRLQKEVPVSYIIFDLLRLDGRDMRTLPLSERQQYLKNLIEPQATIHLIEDFSSGSSLFAAVQTANLEGIVAKKKDSPYLPGKQHRDWFKLKHRRRQACVVGGYTRRNEIANSLLLGVYDNNELAYAGRVGNGLSEEEWLKLNQVLSDMRIKNSPFVALPASLNREALFVEPCLVITVEFAEWTDAMHLRSPVIKDFPKMSPQDCQI